MGKHVVLVEDETNIAEAIRFLLGREGWRVETLANGATAVEAVSYTHLTLPTNREV
mgnify:CR=1 FL=1